MKTKCRYSKAIWDMTWESCLWHKHGGHGQRPDSKCQGCRKWGMEMEFDLAELGKMVVQAGIKDVSLFQMSKDQITTLGKLFIEAKYIVDERNAIKAEDDLPF